MFANKTFRLSALLLAVGLLLGLAATGCSDKDREGGEAQKTKTFYYVYEQETGEKVPATAKDVAAIAFDESGDVIAGVVLGEPEQATGTSGKWSIETTVTKKVDSLAYVFYHEEEVEQEGTTTKLKVADYVDYVSDVSDIVEDENRPQNAEDKVELSTEIQKIDNDETYKVGDEIQVSVLATTAGLKAAGVQPYDVTDKLLLLAVNQDETQEEPVLEAKTGSDYVFVAKNVGVAELGTCYNVDDTYENGIYWNDCIGTVTVAE